jgi:hypothetical protein
LKEALSSVAQGAGRDPDNGILFYYAGYGETQELVDGTKLGWNIPKDCPVLDQDPQGFAKKAISMKDIEEYSMQIMSKHVLMLFDSSFSGEVFSLESAVLGDISEESALPVRQYIIAGIEDEPVPDKSMFKRFLIKGLEGNADLIFKKPISCHYRLFACPVESRRAIPLGRQILFMSCFGFICVPMSLFSVVLALSAS